MNTDRKIKTFICLTFVVWMLSTPLYCFFILGFKHKAFPLLADKGLVTDTQETILFQRERGGIRRIGGNGGRSITKGTLRKLV